MGVARAQSQARYGHTDTRVPANTFQDKNDDDIDFLRPKIILEEAINPKEYIIGPGDIFGVNIKTMEKHFFTIVVGPSGDLLIPGVGSASIYEKTLEESIKLIKQRISKTYKNAEVDVALADLKTYKIHVYGAVINPGFAEVMATSRLDAAIDFLGGLHRYADEENIMIKNKYKESKYISIKKYLNEGDLSNNPVLKEGDVIHIPFIKNQKDNIRNNITLKKVPVLVTGFVHRPGAINYFPGYNAKDYIGLAGGVNEMGNVKKAYLIRDNLKSDIDDSEVIKPGDHIIIPEGTFAVIFGKNSFIQNLTALFSIISTYTIISDRLDN
tara:strand:- start:486 stop:1463 length:978 start_codon:yes stop_codon:yes gene_type:complete